jgi:hypothetical protein
MKHNPYSSTYVAILDLLFKLGQIARVSPMYGTEMNGTQFKRINSGKTSHKLNQTIVIADTTLFRHCSSAEWHLVGTIISELKEYNALWQCSAELKKNSTIRKALKGLIDKQVLIKTETTDIYLVNPAQIRRGDTFAVLATTANMLMNCPKVEPKHITDKKPVGDADFTFDMLQLNN